jgi:tetratricopeptide (TPR) repeat protein
MGRAVEWYERALELDSSSPLVFAGLADVYATLGPPNTPLSEMISRSTAAALRAIALDPLMGEPYAALGKLRAYEWDWLGAERSYRQAIERAPGYAPARYWFGSLWLPRTPYVLCGLRLRAFSDSLQLCHLSSFRCSTRSDLSSGRAPRCTWRSSLSATNWPSSIDRGARDFA